MEPWGLIEPLLSRRTFRTGVGAGFEAVKIGQRTVQWGEGFRLVLVTRESNPHYSPEVRVRVNLVDCASTFNGLTHQMLSLVVRNQQPELENQMSSALRDIAESSAALRQSEDEILRLLAARGDEDNDEYGGGHGASESDAAEAMATQLSAADDDAVGVEDDDAAGGQQDTGGISSSAQGGRALQSPPAARSDQGMDAEVTDSLAGGDTILDDEELVGALQSGRDAAAAAQVKLQQAERVRSRMVQSRAEYHAVALRAASLYFAVADLNRVAHMYSYSMEWFRGVVLAALKADPVPKSSPKIDKLRSLCQSITFAVFKGVTVGLLNAHRFPFLLLLMLRILQSEGHATEKEVLFLLSGQVGSSGAQPPNPAREDVDWADDDGVSSGDFREEDDEDDGIGITASASRADIEVPDKVGGAGALWMSDQSWGNLVGLGNIKSMAGIHRFLAFGEKSDKDPPVAAMRGTSLGASQARASRMNSTGPMRQSSRMGAQSGGGAASRSDTDNPD